MKYRNIKNGAVVETDSKITGSNWEPVTEPIPKKTAVKKGTAKK
jgi:hypothetical protein